MIIESAWLNKFSACTQSIKGDLYFKLTNIMKIWNQQTLFSLNCYHKTVVSMNIQIITLSSDKFSFHYYSLLLALLFTSIFFAFSIYHRCKHATTSFSSSYLFIRLFDHPHIDPVKCSDSDMLPQIIFKRLVNCTHQLLNYIVFQLYK